MTHPSYGRYARLCQSDERVLPPDKCFLNTLAEMASKAAVLIRVVVDAACVAIVAIPVLIFKFLGQPFKRGFFCGDESLMHPHKDSTIPTLVLGLVGIGFTTIVVFIVEAVRCNHPCGRTKSEEYHADRKQWPFLHRLIINCYNILVPFYFGAVMTQLFTDIGKFCIGRLRPHFFDVCRPDFSKINCTLGYIEDFTCLGTDEDKIRNARLSFPSGHASLSVFTMVYFTLYLQVALPRTPCRLLRPLIQLLFILMAYYTCVSRIADYKHHWSDVLGGGVLGLCTALITVFSISPLFSAKKQQSPETTPLTSRHRNDTVVATPTQSSVIDMDGDPKKS